MAMLRFPTIFSCVLQAPLVSIQRPVGVRVSKEDAFNNIAQGRVPILGTIAATVNGYIPPTVTCMVFSA